MRQLAFFPVTNSVNSQKVVTDNDYTCAFALNVMLSIIFCAITLGLYNQLDGFFPGAKLSVLVPFIASSTILTGLSLIYEARLIRKFEFRSLAVRSIVAVIFGGAVGVLLAINGYGVWSLVWQQIVQQGLSLSVLVIFSRWRPNLSVEKGSIGKIARFAAHISMNNLVGFVGYQADTIAIASFLGAKDTGLFNSAKRIGTALNQVMIKPLERVALPALVQFSGDADLLKNAYHRAMAVTALGTAPVFIGVSILSGEIVSLLLGEKWSGAAPVLSALSISFLFSTMAQYNRAVVMVSRKPKLQSIASITGVTLGMVLLVFFIRYGIMGVALAVMIRAALMFPVETIISTRLTGSSLKKVFTVLIPALFSSAIMALCLISIEHYIDFASLAFGIMCKVGSGAIVYALSLWLFFKRKVVALAANY